MTACGKAIAAALAMMSVAAQPVLAQTGVPAVDAVYSARAAAAAPQIRATLNRLNAKITSQHLTFKVGYTVALDRPLSQLAGTRAPADLTTKMREQNLRSRPRLRAPMEASPCDPSAASFDWRKFNRVTPVRDQGACGSCWAFGTLGAFEGSFALVNNSMIDASEQDVLSCSHAGTCSGGWWAFAYVEGTGVASESTYPYTATDAACQQNVARPFRALTWGYVSDTAEIPAVSAIKQALCEHGPLAIAVNVTDAFQAYTGGVFNEHDPGDINHAITLIGWDESKHAWLIKNSWGSDVQHPWGETGGFGTEIGYMWIAYGSNKVGFGAAWVDALSAAPATPTAGPTPPPTTPGLSVWMVIVLALSLGAVELYRRRRGPAAPTRS